MTSDRPNCFVLRTPEVAQHTRQHRSSPAGAAEAVDNYSLATFHVVGHKFGPTQNAHLLRCRVAWQAPTSEVLERDVFNYKR